MPLELGEFCDKRLEQLQIGAWIATSIPNSVAASLISLYLRIDHAVLGIFDADLFLDDLIARRHRFCSPLLVSSILVWAYVSNAPLLIPTVLVLTCPSSARVQNFGPCSGTSDGRVVAL